jgi:hypothetical protein
VSGMKSLLEQQEARLTDAARTEEEWRIVRVIEAVVHEAVKEAVPKAVESAVEDKLEGIREQIRTHGMSQAERRYLDLAIQREARREKLQTAIIEKSTVGFVWFILAIVAAALWKSFVTHVRVG